MTIPAALRGNTARTDSPDQVLQSDRVAEDATTITPAGPSNEATLSDRGIKNEPVASPLPAFAQRTIDCILCRSHLSDEAGQAERVVGVDGKSQVGRETVRTSPYAHVATFSPCHVS